MLLTFDEYNYITICYPGEPGSGSIRGKSKIATKERGVVGEKRKIKWRFFWGCEAEEVEKRRPDPCSSFGGRKWVLVLASLS